ncbi:hypothetical protein [Scytonema sp. NUACC26]
MSHSSTQRQLFEGYDFAYKALLEPFEQKIGKCIDRPRTGSITIRY